MSFVAKEQQLPKWISLEVYIASLPYNFTFVYSAHLKRNFCQTFLTTFTIFKQLPQISMLFNIFEITSGAINDIWHRFLLNYVILCKANIFQNPWLSLLAWLFGSHLPCTGKFQLLTPGNQFLWHEFYLESTVELCGFKLS